MLCPACLAPLEETAENRCDHCRAPVLLGDRYAAVEQLATRSSARTLAGRDTKTDEDVIIKTICVSGLSEWKELELFQRGIGVLRGLDHPGVPKHKDDGSFERGGETFYYWISERFVGRTVAQALEDGARFTEDRAREMADAILEILEYLQSFSPPIVHRDIKPSNVFELEAGGWALIDFDLVKDTLDPEGSSTTALGTAGYAPLEQLMGRAGPASDLYALGATLVAVLSRKEPADMLDAGEGTIDFFGHVRVSPEFAGFIETLLRADADQRPADASQAREALDPSEDVALVVREPLEESMVVADQNTKGIGKVEVPLTKTHPAPKWIRPATFAGAAAVGFFVPAVWWIGLILGVATFFLLGYVLRYPVQLEEGRALHRGGLSNTHEPGRHWVRPHFLESAFSIDRSPIKLDWNPAPTALDHEGGERRWLDIDATLVVEPDPADLGEFFALLKYNRWEEHPQVLPEDLRTEVLARVVEGATLEGLGDEFVTKLEEGLGKLGLILVRRERWDVSYTAAPPSLETHDRARLYLE